MGSWPFIISQTIVVGLWVGLNTLAWLRHWDPFPFILLNLLFSTQAAYAAPIIIMAQNRQAYKDHLRDDHEAAEVELLLKINNQQLEILRYLHAQQGGDALASAVAEAEELAAEVEVVQAESEAIKREL